MKNNLHLYSHIRMQRAYNEWHTCKITVANHNINNIISSLPPLTWGGGAQVGRLCFRSVMKIATQISWLELIVCVWDRLEHYNVLVVVECVFVVGRVWYWPDSINDEALRKG